MCVCFCWGSVNEWMRRKGEDGWGERRGGLCSVVLGGGALKGLVGGWE